MVGALLGGAADTTDAGATSVGAAIAAPTAPRAAAAAAVSAITLLLLLAQLLLLPLPHLNFVSSLTRDGPEES